MQYDDDIEESVVQFKMAASELNRPKENQPSELSKQMEELGEDDDDDDLMMDAETMFIEKQSSNIESITILLDDDPKAKRGQV